MLLGRLVHQLQARNSQPLKSVGRTARLEGSSAQKTRAHGFNALGDGEDLLAVFNRARAGDDRNLLAAYRGAVGKLDYRAFRTKCAAGQLVRGTDAVYVEHARKNLEFAQVQSGGRSHASQNRLGCAGCAMDVDPRLLHHFDDGIYLFFGSLLLHGYNHFLFPVSGASAPVPWPGATARAFLSDANSFLCRDRITSMMRS